MSPPSVEPAVPVIRFDPVDAGAAYAVHTALIFAEITNPALSRNEHWREQRDIAFARFRAAFEVTQ